ncbi:MAG TPA: aspartate aminotransferase family protein [Gemmatimonadales bacterium]|nr:aspartate aminotransferase family protein [Gemmatimonadales bacterium]
MSPRYPSSHVLYRKLRRDYPRIVRGEGCYLFAEDGRRYLDASGGAYVVNVGHGVREIADALACQASRIAYVNGTVFTHDAGEEFARELAALCPGDLDFVYPLASGSEAIEAAIKFARQYWFESGRRSKHRVLALSPSYHGNTLLALSASSRAQYQAPYREWLVDVARAPAFYPYRCSCRGMSPPCRSCTGDAVEDVILQEGADNIAALIAEPVGGSSSGASVPPESYWRRVREICSRHDVLLIADEILTGAGRTGTWSASESYGIVPDIMVLGKGVAGGYVPLSAVVAPERLIDVIANHSAALLHAQTFSHHATLCAAGVATIKYLRENRLIERCAQMGAILHTRLQQLRALPYIGDVRGRGLLAGIEFVEDKNTRVPFPRAASFAETFAASALDLGLIVWANAGQLDDGSGDLALLAPPFVIDEDQIGEIVALLSRALEHTVDQMASHR